MEYRFKSNKTIEEIKKTLSSKLFKDRLTAVNSIWDNKEKGKIFYGEVVNNNFSIKRLSTNLRLKTPSFTGEIIKNETEAVIIGRFRYYFIFNNLVYLFFLLASLFLVIKVGFHLNPVSFCLIEIIGLFICVIPIEMIRRKEKQKVIKFINETI